MTPENSTHICIVCNEPAEAPMTADCNWCDGRYHLNQRNDVEAKDCGQVWVDEQYLALQFACNACLAGTARDPEAFGPSTSPLVGSRPAAPPPTERSRRYKRRA